MTATPWTRSMTVEQAAAAWHVGMAYVAEWIVEGRIRARIRPGAKRPSTQTVVVCAKDVETRLRSGLIQPRSVDDRRLDDFEATRILSRRRPSAGWPPEWEKPTLDRRGRVSPSKTGVTAEDRVREVRAAVSKLGGRNGWVRVSAVKLKLGNRWWVTAGVIRDIVDQLVNDGVLVERLFRPKVGRPSLEIRFADKEVSS